MKVIAQGVVLFYLCAMLSACVSTPGEKTTKFAYTITATNTINPDINGQPSAVLVRIFQLSNSGNFMAARYEDVFGEEKNKLGNELVAVNDHLVDPGSEQLFNVELSANAKFLGVAVGYRSLNSVTWKTVQIIPEKSLLDPIGFFSRSGINILVDKLNVRVAPK